MSSVNVTPKGIRLGDRVIPVIDGLSMPTLERRWLEEYREGGYGCVNTCIAVWENATEATSLIGKWRRFIDANDDLVALAMSVDEIEAVRLSGRTALVLGFQNTAPVEHDIEMFRAFRELGVCIMQLTYNLQNYIGCGYWEENDSGISSRFGRKAIEEMNAVGILIDLSHCGDRTTREAIDRSAKPVAITHANPREYAGKGGYGLGRQKTTEAIRALAGRGGVVGLSPNKNMTKNGAATTIEEFGDMVAWAIDLVGVDAIAIGSDYCPGHPKSVRTWWRYARWSRESAPAASMTVAPHEGWSDWFRTPAGMPNIVAELDRRGLPPDDIAKIIGGNWSRIFAETFPGEAVGR